MPGQRTLGQDHDHYAWSPIVERPVIRWPGSARLAFCVIVNLDHHDWQVEPDYPLPVNPHVGSRAASVYSTRFPDVTGYGQRQYGLRCGIFRLLSVLDKHGIRPSIAMDRTVAENYPFLVEECRRRGLEFIAHGISDRYIIHAGMSEAEERAYIRTSIDAVTRATGTAPLGWSGPHFQETTRTPRLLAEEGIRYVCDWCNDEQPYRMTVSEGELYSMGVTLDLDDYWAMLGNWRRVDEYGQMIEDAFDTLYREGDTTGRMLVLNLHPWVIGQPWRLKYLDKALTALGRYPQVWNASCGEVVEAFRSQER